MQIEVKNKLEDTLIEINRHGYVAIASYKSGNTTFLILKKIKEISTSCLRLNSIPEERELTNFSQHKKFKKTGE